LLEANVADAASGDESVPAPGASGPARAALLLLGLALFAPLFVFGLRGRILDGLLLGLSIELGVRRGLGQLARRTAP